MALAWGPLQALHELLAREDAAGDGDKDRKQSDAALARLLAGDELGGAIQAASLEQLDHALAHDALAVERKPLSFLTLLAAKGAKLDAWASRKAADEKPAQRQAAARLATQLAHFFSQVPISVAAKELKRVSQLAVQYVAIVVELRQAIKAVHPLKSFLRRFHQHGHTAVTAVHAQFFYLCLQAKCYAAAAEILNQPLFEVHAQANVVSAVDFLGYAYYGGVLHLGQKQYQAAIDLFLSAVTAPAVALSAFVVEAYKKLVLASLILHGEAPALPKYAPFVVARHLEVHCGPYTELARAFASDKPVAKLAGVARAHADAFASDGNAGLVKQVVAALQQRRLLQLPRTYVTLALPELAKAAALDNANPAAAEKLLLELIARGDMRAVVDQRKRMVTFVLDADDAPSEAEQARVTATLEREMERMLFVAAQLRAMDTDIVTSAKFQHRAQKEKERRQRSAGGASGGGGPSSQGPDERGALLGQLGTAGAGGYDALMD